MFVRTSLMALALWTSTASSAEPLSCEDELAEVLGELAAHGVVDTEARETARYESCEDELDAAYAELEAFHAAADQVVGDAEPEGAVCVQRCSCGVCLAWDQTISDDQFSKRSLER